MTLDEAVRAVSQRDVLFVSRSVDGDGVVTVAVTPEGSGLTMALTFGVGMRTFTTTFPQGGPAYGITVSEDSLSPRDFEAALEGRFAVETLNVHDTYTLVFVRDGRALEYIGDQRVPLSPDDLLLLPQGVLQRNVHEEGTLACAMPLGLDLVRESWRALAQADDRFAFAFPREDGKEAPSALFFPGGMGIAEPYLAALVEEQLRHPPLWQANVAPLLARTGIELARHVEVMPIDCKRPAQQLVQEVLAYLTRHFADISLTQIAERFGYHPTYLSTLLKQQTGMSYVRLLTKYRLEHATMLLREGQLSVDEVAAACGYRDRTSFYKALRKRYGCAPRDLGVPKRRTEAS